MFEYMTDNITQGSLYKLAGRTDDVCTLDLREGSDIFQIFGPKVTVVLIYTQRERKMLENDFNSLDDVPNVKAEWLNSLFNKGKDKALILQTEGIPVKDIVGVFVLHYTPNNNTYTNTEVKRSLNIMEIPFEPYGGGRDIGWMYESLKRQKKAGVGFMPEDDALYTAYRFIVDRDDMSEDEKRKVIDKDGHIVMSNVGYYYLSWGEEAGLLKEGEKELLAELKNEKVRERNAILEEELEKVGIHYSYFRKNYKEQAVFLLQRLLSFRDRAFNLSGKHPLYMDFRSFLHIYLRHVDMVNMGDQLALKDKFQLYEKDVMYMIDHVMHNINNDYQLFRDKNPERTYKRYGDMAYYCRGDYYEIYVDKTGRLESFYKASRDGKGA